MITVGIDIGARMTKAVVLRGDDTHIAACVFTGFEQAQAGERALADALAAARHARAEVACLITTGAGRQAFPSAARDVTEITADAHAIAFLHPQVRTLIDVGAEEARALRCAEGKVVDFVVNEKCAAGAGVFIETMARALEVDLEEMGVLSQQATTTLPLNAQCTVFAESEVVSLIHARTPKPAIVRAVHDAIAGRVAAMVRRIGIAPPVALVGGVARNSGFVDALERALEVSVLVPAEPEFVSALGAALIAREA